MNAGKTLFSQLMDCLPWSTFARIVARYHGDHSVQTFPCTEQYRAMAFAQLTYRESLRDIEACLSAQPAKLWHMGFRGPVRRSTLADAERGPRLAHLRGVRAAADRAGEAAICGREPVADLNNTVYALDSTTIDLCLSLFPWAHFRIDESRREDAHAARFARQHPEFHPHLGRQAARRSRARYAGAGSGRHLCHGSRVCRFRPPVSAAPGRRVFRDARQIQSQRPPGLFGRDRSHDRCHRRSNHRAGRALHEARLSGASPARALQGPENRENAGISDQS